MRTQNFVEEKIRLWNDHVTVPSHRDKVVRYIHNKNLSFRLEFDFHQGPVGDPILISDFQLCVIPLAQWMNTRIFTACGGKEKLNRIMEGYEQGNKSAAC